MNKTRIRYEFPRHTAASLRKFVSHCRDEKDRQKLQKIICLESNATLQFIYKLLLLHGFLNVNEIYWIRKEKLKFHGRKKKQMPARFKWFYIVVVRT